MLRLWGRNVTVGMNLLCFSFLCFTLVLMWTAPASNTATLCAPAATWTPSNLLTVNSHPYFPAAILRGCKSWFHSLRSSIIWFDCAQVKWIISGELIDWCCTVEALKYPDRFADTEEVTRKFSYLLQPGATTRLSRRTTLWSRSGSCRPTWPSCRRTWSRRRCVGRRPRSWRGTWARSWRPWRRSWRTRWTPRRPSRSSGSQIERHSLVFNMD